MIVDHIRYYGFTDSLWDQDIDTISGEEVT